MGKDEGFIPLCRQHTGWRNGVVNNVNLMYVSTAGLGASFQ